MHPFLLHNGVVHAATDKTLSPGQVGLLNGWGVFSTLRVKDGVLFAWERHYARMRKDAALMHIPFPADSAGFRAELGKLIDANQAWNATMRVAVVRNRGGAFEAPSSTPFDIIAFTKGLADWGSGVKLCVTPNARHSESPYASAKILSWSPNLAMLEEAQRRGFDETILLDDRGLVSECTSANIFLVFGTGVVTPSLRCGCLPGVTRSIFLEEIRMPGMSMTEREVRPEELFAADEVFITSSTRDVLPVLEIDGRILERKGSVSSLLNNAFQEHLDRYVAGQRKTAEGVLN
jgi:branched-chain amino acid aminotransferase